MFIVKITESKSEDVKRQASSAEAPSFLSFVVSNAFVWYPTCWPLG